MDFNPSYSSIKSYNIKTTDGIDMIFNPIIVRLKPWTSSNIRLRIPLSILLDISNLNILSVYIYNNMFCDIFSKIFRKKEKNVEKIEDKKLEENP